MYQSVGTRICFSDSGEKITGTIIMIFKYDTIDYWDRDNVKYVVVSGEKCYTTTNGKSTQSFTKFSAVKSPSVGHGPYSIHSYGKLSKRYNIRGRSGGGRERGGRLYISIYSRTTGTTQVRESSVELGWDFIRITQEHGDTKFTEMVDDTCPKVKSYNIMTGALDPRRFVDERPQPIDFYRTLCPFFGTASYRKLKFYVGIKKLPIKCSTLTIFTDSEGIKYNTDIENQRVVPIPKENVFRDKDGEEWIVDTKIDGNVERYVENVQPQKDFTSASFSLNPSPLIERQQHDLFPESQLKSLEICKRLGEFCNGIKYNIGDIFVGNKMIIGIYLTKNFRDEWEIKYLVAPFISICDKSGRINVDSKKAHFIKSYYYKCCVIDYVKSNQDWLPENTNEIGFQTPNIETLYDLILENDTSYIEEEKKKKNCRTNHQRFNSLCYGKNESGRYCMTPVKATGDYCNKHGGPRHNSPKCDHSGCPGQEPMRIEECRRKISIYKLMQTKFTRNIKFMYEKENMDIWNTYYYWKKL